MKLMFVILCAVLIVQNEAARILGVFPIPSISHQVVFRPLTQELARRGHEVVIITPDPAFPKGKTPANLTEIDLHELSYDVWRKTFLTLVTGNQHDLISQFEITSKIVEVIFEKQLETEEVKNIINGNEHFDLILIEDCIKPALAFAHIFKAPVITISSYGAFIGSYDAIGAPAHPLLYPSPLRQRLYNLTFWEKLTELYNHYSFIRIIKLFEQKCDILLKRHFGKDIPPTNELLNEISMTFLNVHPVFEGNLPVPPNIIHIWGTHQNPKKELPQDLKSYLDSSKHGVIYMSFGTNADPANLPPDTIQMFIRVLSQLPYDVLWKWNKDELPGKSKNIKISKWFPQSDLLKHSKIKLFITQGGLQSTDEAITAGVPLVGIPLLGDQWYNAEKYVHLKIGAMLDIETVTEEQFRSAITTVIEDESYKTNIKKLGALMRDQPMESLERAVWWTEYVLRHGGAKHLRSPAANISWAEYLEIEFVLTLLLGLTLIVSTVIIALYFLYSFISRKISNVKLKKL